MNTQSVSRCCLHIRPWFLYQRIHFFWGSNFWHNWSFTFATDFSIGMVDQVSAESTHYTNHFAAAPWILRWFAEWIVRKKQALRSKVQRWSESCIVHLSFSRIPDPTHGKLRILDVHCLWNCLPWHLQQYSTVLQVYIVRSMPFFFFSWTEKRPMSQRKYFLRNSSPFQNSKKKSS